MDIKAIETVYKGYRFRSRLEARWAVFFDTLGLKWEYEPEGFVMPSGTHYLPDFKVLTKHGATHWYEVKPETTTEDQKFQEFFETLNCRESRNKATAGLLCGDPLSHLFGGRGCVCPNCGFLEASLNGLSVSYIPEGDTSRVYCHACDWGMGPDMQKRSSAYDVSFMSWTDAGEFGIRCAFHKGDVVALRGDFEAGLEKFRVAATKARSARFEHNERESMARA